jgi:uncharacterized membrane protein YeaQ/YmgE (transglycosylase-associated protein family)
MWTMVSWIVLGALAGWIASLIAGPSEQISGWMNIVVGVIGAFVGGLILATFGVATAGTSTAGLLMAVLGAAILLSVVKALRSSSV